MTIDTHKFVSEVRRGVDGEPSTAAAPALLWRESPEHAHLFVPKEGDDEPWKAYAVMWLLIAGVCMVVGACGYWILRALDEDRWYWTVVMILETTVASVGAVISGVITCQYLAARKAFYDRVRLHRSNELEAAIDSLGDGLTLEKLFVLNRRQLDEYHVLTVRHARIAFRNATIASVVAFALLIVGVVTVVQQPERAAATYVAGGLTGLGGVLSTFLSSVFFRSYHKAGEQLRAYYEEPSRTGKVLTMERLVEHPSGGGPPHPEDTALRRRLVDALVQDFLGRSLPGSAAGQNPAPDEAS